MDNICQIYERISSGTFFTDHSVDLGPNSANLQGQRHQQGK